MPSRILVRLAAFALAFAAGATTGKLLRRDDAPRGIAPQVPAAARKCGGNGASGADVGLDKPAVDSAPPAVGRTSRLSILSKPRAQYTDSARANGLQGIVTLRVVFRADGQVGEVDVVKGLPDGLTEAAIGAAKKIKFEPARLDGVPTTVRKVVEYKFAIY